MEEILNLSRQFLLFFNKHLLFLLTVIVLFVAWLLAYILYSYVVITREQYKIYLRIWFIELPQILLMDLPENFDLQDLIIQAHDRRNRRNGWFLQVYRNPAGDLRGFLSVGGILNIDDAEPFALIKDMPNSQMGIGVYGQTPAQTLESLPPGGWSIKDVPDFDWIHTRNVHREWLGHGQEIFSYTYQEYQQELDSIGGLRGLRDLYR